MVYMTAGADCLAGRPPPGLTLLITKWVICQCRQQEQQMSREKVSSKTYR